MSSLASKKSQKFLSAPPNTSPASNPKQKKLSNFFSPGPSSPLPVADPIIMCQQKIPRGPLYRLIKLDAEKRVHQVRVKAWKTLNCKIFNMTKKGRNPLEENVSVPLCSPTLIKCLKNVKGLGIWNTEPKMKFCVHKLRPEKLFLCKDLKIEKIRNMVKRSVNLNSLKDLIIESYGSSCRDSWRLLSRFPQIQSLSHLNCSVLHPQKKQKDPRLKFRLAGLQAFRFSEDLLYSFKDFCGLAWCKQLKHLSVKIHSKSKTEIQPHLKELNGLISLRLDIPWCQGADVLSFNFEIFEEYKQLELLHLTLGPNFLEESWNTILQLPKLKDLAFIKTKSSYIFQSPLKEKKVAASLLQLENFKISYNPFSAELCEEILSKIHVSGTLDLEIALKNVPQFFQNRFPLPLEKVQKLKFRVVGKETITFLPYGQYIQDISSFFKRQSALKSLILEIEKWSSSILNPVLEGLECLTCLESFEISQMAYDFNKDDFLSIKKVLKKHEMLHTVKLELQKMKPWTEEFERLVRVFKALKCLQNLSLNFDFGYVNISLLPNVMGFVNLAKKLKSLEIKGKSSQLFSQEVEKVIGKERSLWKASKAPEEGRIDYEQRNFMYVW